MKISTFFDRLDASKRGQAKFSILEYIVVSIIFIALALVTIWLLYIISFKSMGQDMEENNNAGLIAAGSFVFVLFIIVIPLLIASIVSSTILMVMGISGLRANTKEYNIFYITIICISIFLFALIIVRLVLSFNGIY